MSVRVGPLRPLNYCGNDLWNVESPHKSLALCLDALNDITMILEFNGHLQETEILVKALRRIKYPYGEPEAEDIPAD